MLRSDLCDYSDAYVWITNTRNNAKFDRRLTLKNNPTIYFVYFKN